MVADLEEKLAEMEALSAGMAPPNSSMQASTTSEADQSGFAVSGDEVTVKSAGPRHGEGTATGNIVEEIVVNEEEDRAQERGKHSSSSEENGFVKVSGYDAQRATEDDDAERRPSEGTWRYIQKWWRYKFSICMSVYPELQGRVPQKYAELLHRCSESFKSFE